MKKRRKEGLGGRKKEEMASRRYWVWEKEKKEGGFNNNMVQLCLFCKLKFDRIELGGNFLLVAKTPSFLPRLNISNTLYFLLFSWWHTGLLLHACSEFF
jgi:hypothetical protein